MFPVILFAVAGPAAQAQDIDLDCESLAEQMIERLSAESLLAPGAVNGKRVKAIGLELCGGAEVSAQEQHETGKQEALDNWFFEKRADKPGNQRLRNLKR